MTTEAADNSLIAMPERGLRLGGGVPSTSSARLECFVRLFEDAADRRLARPQSAPARRTKGGI